MIRVEVTWKNPTLRERYKIGELTYTGKEYIFRYYNDLEKAKKVGFKEIGEFKDFETEYISSELFLTFLTRIPNRKRKDFKKFLEENKISEEADDLEILLATRGVLTTDTIELFEKINFEKNEIGCFLVGTRHYINENTYLNENMEIELVSELDNEYDNFAIYANNLKKEKLGYIPNIFSKDMTSWLKNSNYSVKIKKLLKLDTGKRIEIYINIQK